MDNDMKRIRIGKLTLNVGAGKDISKLEKGIMLIKHLTSHDAVKTKTRKRIPGWGLRPGLPIGCKLTLRGDVRGLIRSFLSAKRNILKRSQFDNSGNIAFGIHEYIDIPDIDYSPEIGIMGFQVCITLTRPGYRIKSRRIGKRRIPRRHRITRDEAVEFMKKEFNITIGD